MSDAASAALSQATWVAAAAAIATAVILSVTLCVAWANLGAFKNAERVRRTTDPFFSFYTQEYLEENDQIGAPPFRRTPYMAIKNVIVFKRLVKGEIVLMVHNYLEAVAALHWKKLIDSELYFDSFAKVIVDVYQPLTNRLNDLGSPLTPYSRIPQLHDDAQAYLKRREKKEPKMQAKA